MNKQRMKKKDIQQQLLHAFGIRVARSEVIQSLWSGYGAIVRCWQQHDNLEQPFIAKIINTSAIPAHPRGWAGATSHRRKLSSFVNEQCFYQDFTDKLASCARVPQFIDCTNTNDGMILLLSDADAQGFSQRVSHPTPKQLTDCLHWLAGLHAYFLQHGAATSLWERGNYWHLATRQDEYAQMADGQLKQQAAALDKMLADAHYQTILHGDAKIANFCFSENECLALDFQYVGPGVGVVDIMYFLGSCLTEQQLDEQANSAFEQYFTALKSALSDEYLHAHWQSLEKEWRRLIPVAWADFERFLQGWMPSHHKLHGYSARQTQRGLARL
jgi:hypothetical protein